MNEEIEQQLNQVGIVTDTRLRARRMLDALGKSWHIAVVKDSTVSVIEINFAIKLIQAILSGASEFHDYVGTTSINVSFERREERNISPNPSPLRLDQTSETDLTKGFKAMGTGDY
jgi:hypothetical protein